MDPNSIEAVILRLSLSIDKLEKRFDATNSSDDQHHQSAEMDWKMVSLVVDRVLLFVFLLAMIISSLAILTSSPHIYTASLSDLRHAGLPYTNSNVSHIQEPCRTKPPNELT